MNDVESKNYEVENVGLINDVNFSDVYIPFDRKTFIWGGKTNAGLKLVKFDDFDEFFEELEKAYAGIVNPILLEGDAIGAIIMLIPDMGNAPGESDIKVVSTAAQILSRQIET
jgi:hypothetical protein